MQQYKEDRLCKKCGHGSITDKWVDFYNEMLNVQARTGSNKELKKEDYPDYISKTCNNCGYNWKEKPINMMQH